MIWSNRSYRNIKEKIRTKQVINERCKNIRNKIIENQRIRYTLVWLIFNVIIKLKRMWIISYNVKIMLT